MYVVVMNVTDETLPFARKAAPLTPSWLRRPGRDTLENMAFFAGAAFMQLDDWQGRPEGAHALFRARLSLDAASACLQYLGRPEQARDLRDALAFLRPGDLPGPAGEVYLKWQQAVARPLSTKALVRVLPDVDPRHISAAMKPAQGSPLMRSATVLETALEDHQYAAYDALMLADAVLAKAFGWQYLTPLFARALRPVDVRKRGDALRLVCHQALTRAAIDAAALASDLSLRATYLKGVAPKLRAKGAGQAVEMFLTRDAVAPSALPLPDRAARRLCERLVDLGAVRELTGRSSFRLYGV